MEPGLGGEAEQQAAVKRRVSKSVDATIRLDEVQTGPLPRSTRTTRLPYLRIMSGNELGMRTRLCGSALVGRDPHADIVLSDAGVSYHHARLEDRGGSWTVIDLGSTNGTRMEGERVDECELHPGQRLVFGATLARFEVQTADDQAYDEARERLMNIDELSGLFVRRKFDQDLRIHVARALKTQSKLGLLVMDLDGLKKINDEHGHLFGAFVIGRTGELVGELLEGQGFAARFGGDEYVAALPGCDYAASHRLAQEILYAVRDENYLYQGKVLHPGISIGVAVFPDHAENASTLFEQADRAMYQAKRAGKNRVAGASS